MFDTRAESDAILYETKGDVATLTINRPDRHNALTLGAWKQLSNRIEEFQNSLNSKVLIIRGAGERAFASGSDIDELPKVYSDSSVSVDYDRTLLRTQQRLYECPKPVLAMIYGHCIGGGLGIASACDIRFAAENARFALPPARLGLINGVSSMHRLVRLIGQSATRDLIYSGRSIDASEALQAGLLNRVYTQGSLEDETYTYAQQIADNSQYSVRVSKQLLNQIDCGLVDDDDRYFALVRDSVDGEDFAEGFDAFKSKRKPRFPYR